MPCFGDYLNTTRGIDPEDWLVRFPNVSRMPVIGHSVDAGEVKAVTLAMESGIPMVVHGYDTLPEWIAQPLRTSDLATSRESSSGLR